MTVRSNECESRRRLPTLAAALLLLLVAATGSACSWLTGEFAALDRTPPSVDRHAAEPERP